MVFLKAAVKAVMMVEKKVALLAVNLVVLLANESVD
jgi:hypothetical protein